MGGKGSGKKGQELRKAAGLLAQEFRTQTGPARLLASQQIAEALQTGGVGARIPVIQQAVEQSRQAASRAMQGTRESLAAAGLARDPIGQSILAQQRIQGEQATAGIAPAMAAEIAGMGGNLITAGLGPITGAGASVVGSGMQRAGQAKAGEAAGIGQGAQGAGMVVAAIIL